MRRLFPLIAAVILVDTAFYSAITPLLPDYRDDLGLSKTAAGLLSASYAAGTLTAALPSGWLAGRAGGRTATVLGLALLGVTSVAFGFARDIVLLDAARFLQGVGGACSWAGCLTWLISETPPERRGEAIGAALGAAVVGLLFGPAVGALAAEIGTETVFSGAALLAGALIAWALSTPASRGGRLASWGALAGALRRGPLPAAVWLFTLPALYTGTLEVLVPLRMDDLGAAALAIGAVFVAGAAVEAVLSPVLGRFSDRRGRWLPLRVGLVGAGLTAIVLPLPGSAALLGAATLITITALAFFWAPAGALLSDAAEASGLDQGLAFGVMNLAWAGGQVVGGGASGALADATSDAVPYGVLGVVCLITLVVAQGSRAAEGRDSNPRWT
jgi:MFS family permease